MQVTAFSIFVARSGNRRPVILELETDSGVRGIGEAGVAYGLGDTAAAEMLKAMALRHVLGRDPGPVEAIWNEIYDLGFWTRGGGAIAFSALSAVEIALWDIKGRALGAPVHALLGGPVVRDLPLYANGWWIGCDTPDEFAEAGVRTVARGYRGLKLYPLAMPDPLTVLRHPERRHLDRALVPKAVARVRALRDAVGPDVEIMLDFGGGLAADELLRVLAAIEGCDVAFVEEPVDPALPEALAAVARRTTIPLAAGERRYGRYGFLPLLQAGAVSVLQPDACNTGGILEARKIAAMGEAYNLRVAPHNYGSTLATAIAAQLSATLPNLMVLEHFPDYDREPGYLAVLHDPLEARVRDGLMPVPGGPGLGVSLHRENLAPFLWARCTLEDAP